MIILMFAVAEGRLEFKRMLGQHSCRCGYCTADLALASAAVQTHKPTLFHEYIHTYTFSQCLTAFQLQIHSNERVYIKCQACELINARCKV